jgi:hypothetical protein
MAMMIQVKVFWIVMLCIVVRYLAASITLKIEVARSSKMLVSYHTTMWHHNLEDLDLNLDNFFMWMLIMFLKFICL